MSDTDQQGMSEPQGSPKPKTRRGPLFAPLPAEETGRKDEAAAPASVDSLPPEPAATAPQHEQPPESEESGAAIHPESASVETQPTGQTPPEQAPPEPANPRDEAWQEDVWRETRDEADPPPPPLPPPERRSSRSLALAALALSILLPALLYVYLQMSGAFDRQDGERIAGLESSVAALRASPAPKPEVTRSELDKLAARLDALEKSVAALERRPVSQSAPGPSGPGPSLAELGGQIEAASREAKDALARARAAEDAGKGVAGLASRLDLLETRIAAVEKRLAAGESAGPARPKESANAPSILVMARVVAADLRSGAPFAGELDTLARLGADPALVAWLRPFADKGAPLPASLASDFEAELNAAREKVTKAEAPQGWWGSFTAKLGSLVRVRHIGADDPGSPAAGVETALSRGDMVAALDAWNGLPVFEKGATPNSGARIKALANAYDAAKRIGDAALEAIRRSGTTDNGG
jgi:hypothetical protein